MTPLRSLAQRVPGGAFTRAVVTVAGGTGGGQLIVIVASPILTRLFGPADYGVFAVGIALLSILLTVTCLRYEYAIPLPRDEVTAANLLVLSLVINAGVTVLAGAGLWIAGAGFLGLFGASSLSPYVLVISVGQLGGGMANALTNWAVRTKSFTDIAASRLIQGGSLVGGQLGLGVLRLGPLGLLLGDAISRLVAAGWLVRAVWRGHGTSIRRVSFAGILNVATRYRRFPILSSWSALLATGALQAPLLLIAAAYGPVAGGEYALAARLCAIPLALVANAVGQVFVAEAAQLAQSDPAALPPLFRRTTSSLLRVALGPALLGMIAAPLLAAPLFGEVWGPAGLFVAILLPSYVVEFVAGATGDLLYVLERQDLHLAREVLRFAFVGGAVPIAAALQLSAVHAVTLLSLAGCVTYVIYGVITWRALIGHTARLRPANVESP